MRLSVRRQPAKCICANSADAPSTHRGAVHMDPRCPHSGLLHTTRLYAETRQKQDRERERKQRAHKARAANRPVRRIVL